MAADATETANSNKAAVQKAHVLIEQAANRLLQDRRNVGAVVKLLVGRNGQLLEPTVAVESR